MTSLSEVAGPGTLPAMPPIVAWQFLLHVSPQPVRADAAASVWPVDVPTWITAIATFGLLVGAIVTAVYARKAFLGQEAQLAEQRRINEEQTLVLKLQAAELRESTEERQREAGRRHQAQASLVFTGVQNPGHRFSHPYAKNGSDFPVYDVQLWQAYPGGLSDPFDVGMIPPGGGGADGRDIPYRDALDGTVLTFRDAAGARWMRMPDGTIKEQEHDSARDSILTALGRPLPVPTEPAPAIESAGRPKEPQAPGQK
jgi:hypothetical protein